MRATRPPPGPAVGDGAADPGSTRIRTAVARRSADWAIRWVTFISAARRRRMGAGADVIPGNGGGMPSRASSRATRATAVSAIFRLMRSWAIVTRIRPVARRSPRRAGTVRARAPGRAAAARVAASASTRPSPEAPSRPSTPTSVAVERRIPSICGPVSLGFADRTRAATPATCGEDIEVPLIAA